MDQCCDAAIDFLRDFLKGLPWLHMGWALDCASGSGRLSEKLLLEKFFFVDMFDSCPEAVKLAVQLRAKDPCVCQVSQATL